MQMCIAEYSWEYIQQIFVNNLHIVFLHITSLEAIYSKQLSISMLWHRQAIFHRKKTSCLPLLNTELKPGPNSIARPYDQWAFSPLNPTAGWLSYLALAIYMDVVNSDALAQASNFGIKRRQVVFLCWITIFMLVCQLYHLPFKRHFISDEKNLCTDIWLTFDFFSAAFDHSSWNSPTIPWPWKKLNYPWFSLIHDNPVMFTSHRFMWR